MYIPYNKLSKTIALFCPLSWRKTIRNYGYKLSLLQNIAFVKRNTRSVLKKLRNKKEKIIIAFSVYDETKWKCQSLYDFMNTSEDLEPYIFVTKINSSQSHFSYCDSTAVEKAYKFFKSNHMRVLYAYNTKNNSYIPFKDMPVKPDIIIYQHPRFLAENQEPLGCSKFALNCYIPYFLPISNEPYQYEMEFHQYVYKHYLLNDTLKNEYAPKMLNKGENLVAAGYPSLDYFYLNKDKVYEQKDYVIYAPHWSVDINNHLGWGTFLWNGHYILKYAKSHPEIHWVFKPHPCLAGYLRTKKIMTDAEISEYWNEWRKIGKVLESGNYLDIFMQSKAMITDCGTFLSEYYYTKKPLIYLFNTNKAPKYNKMVSNMMESFYRVDNLKSLAETLDDVVLKGKYKSIQGRQDLDINNYAAKNITNDLLQDILRR